MTVQVRQDIIAKRLAMPPRRTASANWITRNDLRAPYAARQRRGES
jgi:hypothetical protein